MDKKELRKSIMEKRDKLGDELREQKNKQIYQRVIATNYFQAAQVIFIFVSYLSEVDTKSIIKHALALGKTICVPRVKSKAEGLELIRIQSLEELQLGYHGILEPSDKGERINPALLDLIVMPGVAFDLMGGRIGYGGGFYDRFLRELEKPVTRIAIGYEMQILDSIPMEEHDARIHGIITEDRVHMVEPQTIYEEQTTSRREDTTC